VRDIKVDSKGTVWVAQGLSHLAIVEGGLRTFNGRAWKTFAATANQGAEKDFNWNLRPVSMEGIAFDAKGLPYVLTGSLGVVHFDGKEWSQKTLGWPKYQSVSSLHVTLGGLAVIGANDAGVLLWKLGTTEVKRVRLKD
jgi:hypothetical protein